MNTFCPISFTTVNENTIRVVSSLMFILTLFLLVNINNSAVYVSLFMIVDFSTRGFGNAKYSFVSQLSKQIFLVLRLPEKKINAGPKIFAAQVGAIMSAVVFIGFLVDIAIISYLFASILAVCTFLELAIGFCVACKIYPLFRKFIPSSLDSSGL